MAFHYFVDTELLFGVELGYALLFGSGDTLIAVFLWIGGTIKPAYPDSLTMYGGL